MSTDFVYTAIIDVLSYKNRLSRDVQRGEESFKDDLVESLSVFNGVNTAIFGVQAISDTIIITCAKHDKFVEFLGILKKVFVSFMERGLYVRGGVAYSKHFQSGRITYSHAVARAHEIESREAIYPRIVLDVNILDMYNTAKGFPAIFGQGLLVKHNDIVFLSVVDRESWDKIYEMAKNIYTQDAAELGRSEAAFMKHVWFENYLFSMAGAIPGKPRYIPSPEVI